MEAEEPYNNDNFYALSDEKQLQFQFSNTHPHRQDRRSKRPQSASIRVTKDKHNKNRLIKRNKNQYDANYNVEDVITSGSAADVKALMGTPGAFRENQITNTSQYNRSPKKIQK